MILLVLMSRIVLIICMPIGKDSGFSVILEVRAGGDGATVAHATRGFQDMP